MLHHFFVRLDYSTVQNVRLKKLLVKRVEDNDDPMGDSSCVA